MIGIYGIFRKSDDKCVYVGESKRIEKRIIEHLKGGSKIHLEGDLYYGKVLEEHDIDDHLYRLQRESFWINELNAELNVIRDASCWNKGKTGIYSEDALMKISQTHKGKHLSDEHKKKIGQSNKGENNGQYHKIRPKEHCKKLSESLKGHKGHKANKGRRYLNNGTINKMVKPDELQQYLDDGWKLGRIKK